MIVYVVHRALVPPVIKFSMLDMVEPCHINLTQLGRVKLILPIREVSSNVNNPTRKFFV